MLKKRVWKCPQSAGKPRTESQTVGKETNRKMASALADNVNIQEQSCREKRTSGKRERIAFRCWTFCQWWRRKVVVDARYCQQNAPQTLYPKTRPTLLVHTTDFKTQRCGLWDFTKQELLELKYWNFKTFVRANHIESSSSKSERTTAAPTPIGSRAVSDNVPPTR
jgi:hypothetical protein